MIGAIAGDIIGSVFEHDPIKTTNFPLFTDSSRFTDDTVLSVAIADAILNQTDLIITAGWSIPGDEIFDAIF